MPISFFFNKYSQLVLAEMFKKIDEAASESLILFTIVHFNSENKLLSLNDGSNILSISTFEQMLVKTNLPGLLYKTAITRLIFAIL